MLEYYHCPECSAEIGVEIGAADDDMVECPECGLSWLVGDLEPCAEADE